MTIKAAVLTSILGTTLAGSTFFGGAAQATVTDLVNLTFQSGATFTGEVTFASDYSYVTAVTGTLKDYTYNVGYQDGGSDSINWVYDNGANYSTGTGNYSTFLMDGPGSGYSNSAEYTNFIQFAYNYSSAPTLSLTSGDSAGGTDNYVDSIDPLVNGSISSAVPELSTWAMMLVGFAGLGFAAYRQSKKRVATCARDLGEMQVAA